MKFNLTYDKKFLPMAVALADFKKAVKNADSKPLKICVERNKGYNFVYSLDIFAGESQDLKMRNYKIVERLIKSILWVAGGYKIYILGDDELANRIKHDYTSEGIRAFDADFMAGVYEKPFEILAVSEKDFPAEKGCSLAIGGHLKGCRIGFDAGGSDRKVSAVIDGEVASFTVNVY